jgi:PIN domain nuclease of toxin-antitoxin system
MTEQAFLLDSNVVVWLDQKPRRIPDSVLHRLESASQVFLSAVTAWELAIKETLGDLTLLQPVSKLIHTHQMIELPVTIRHGEAVGNLPFHHRDPFDRLLVAQAIVEGLILVTSERQLLKYGVPILLV